MDLFILLLALAVPPALNVWATRLVVRDGLSEPGQKALQLLLVWLLPVVGSVIVWGVHRGDESVPLRYRELPNPGDDTGGGTGSHFNRGPMDASD